MVVRLGWEGERVRLATIDVGTNTALLLISEWKDNRLIEVYNGVGFVRLGEGMDASGRVSDDALARLQAVLFSHMEAIRRFDAAHIIITVTSASRDAQDGHRIHTLVRNMTGTEFTILSGEEEAKVTYLGAVAGMPESTLRSFLGETITVIDVGGGSTEFVQGKGEDIHFKKSLNMGSVRMTERFFSSQPAQGEEIESGRAHFQSMMKESLAGSLPSRYCIGASGTPIILSLLHTGLKELSDAESAVSMSVSELDAWSRRLFGMTRSEVTALYPSKMKGRADVLPAGVLILLEALTYLRSEQLFVSPFGVRHGVALRYFLESSS